MNKKKNKDYIKIVPMTTAEEIDRMREREYDNFMERHGRFDFKLFYSEVIEGKRCEHSGKNA